MRNQEDNDCKISITMRVIKDILQDKTNRPLLITNVLVVFIILYLICFIVG